MARTLWVMGEVVAGVAVGGLISALVVPAAERQGLTTGPWVAVVAIAVGLVVCFSVGERLRRGPHRG